METEEMKGETVTEPIELPFWTTFVEPDGKPPWPWLKDWDFVDGDRSQKVVYTMSYVAPSVYEYRVWGVDVESLSRTRHLGRITWGMIPLRVIGSEDDQRNELKNYRAGIRLGL